MSEEQRELYRRFMRWISRHLVSLSCVYYHVDNAGKVTAGPFLAACSGFVMSFGEVWYLITAGHVISGKESLNELFASPNVKIVECFLVDLFGLDAKHQNTIPFDYEGSIRYGVDKDGVDWGFVMLNPNLRRLLETNGVVAVAETNWMLQHRVEDFFGYLLLGIPKESVIADPSLAKGDSDSYGTAGIALLQIKKLDAVPEGAETTPMDRFIGEITNLGELRSIEGMSGGPIFGLAIINDQLFYWVVAIQSSWYGGKYVFGTLVPPVARAFYEALVSYSPPEITGETVPDEYTSDD
jgi:hypothetical protein